MAKRWEYGKSPNPRNWHQTASAIKSNAKRPVRAIDKLIDAVEQLKVKK